MALNELLAQLNWIDLLIFLPILFRSIYIGLRQGVITEFFKILGVISASYFTLHYYPLLGNFLAGAMPVTLELEPCLIFSYLFLFFLVIITFIFIRQVILTVTKIETVNLLMIWGGVILGFLRGIFLTSMIFIFLFLLTNNYLTGSVRQSYFGNKVIRVAPVTYRFIFDNLVVNFFPDEKLNQGIFKMLDENLEEAK